MKIKLFYIVFLLLFFAQCKEKDGLKPLPENTVELKMTFDLPVSTDISKLTVESGIYSGQIKRSTRSARGIAEVNKVEVSVPVGAGADNKSVFVWVFDANNIPIMCATVENPQNRTMAVTTADIIGTHVETLMNFSPMLALQMSKEERVTLMKEVKNFNEYLELERLITTAFIGNPFPTFNDVISNPSVMQQVGVFWKNVDTKLFSIPNPFVDDQNGVALNFENGGYGRTNQTLNFNIVNSRRRWLGVSVEGYKGGNKVFTYDQETSSLNFLNTTVKSPEAYDVNLSTLINVGKRIKTGEKVSETKGFSNLKLNGADKIKIQVYGLGFRGVSSSILNDPSFQKRSVIPVAFSIADNFFFPLMELTSGLNTRSFDEMAGRPPNDPTVKFLLKVGETAVSSTFDKALKVGFTQEEEKLTLIKMIKDFSGTAIQTIKDDPSLFNHVIRDLLGSAAVNNQAAILKQMSGYYRALEGGLQLYNIGDFFYTIITGNPYVEYNYAIENNQLTYDISSIISPATLEALKAKGAVIYAGNTPPSLNGAYFVSPNTLKVRYGPNDGFAVGKVFSDYVYIFKNQKGQAIDLNVDIRNDGSIDDAGSGSVIAGNGNKFTVYATTERTNEDNIYIKTVSIISGEITSNGISNFEDAFIITQKERDFESKIIPVNAGRIVYDSDKLSEKIDWTSTRRKAVTGKLGDSIYSVK